VRRLNDGREFKIIKIFYVRDQLVERLHQLGWQAKVYEHPTIFYMAKANWKYKSSGIANTDHSEFLN